MPIMKKTIIASLILAVAALAGCSAVNKITQQKHDYTDASSGPSGLSRKCVVLGYDGPVRALSEVSVITTDGTLSINSIDGQSTSKFREWKNKSLSVNGRYQLHLPPGEHVLRMGFDDGRSRVRKWSVADQTLTINVKAGQVLHLARWDQDSKWGINQYEGASAMSEIKSDFNGFRKDHLSDAN